MSPMTMITDMTELAVSQDETSSSESQTAQLEGPAVEHAGSWKQRRDRLLRRLEQAGSGTPLAAHSAWAVVHGIQRARAMADEVTCECFLDSEVGGGEDALMAAGGGENVESPDSTSKQRAVSRLECLLDQNG